MSLETEIKNWVNSLLTLLENRPTDTWEWEVQIACQNKNTKLEINYNEDAALWMGQEYSEQREGNIRVMEPGLFIEGSRSEFLSRFFSHRQSIEEQLRTIDEGRNP